MICISFFLHLSTSYCPTLLLNLLFILWILNILFICTVIIFYITGIAVEFIILDIQFVTYLTFRTINLLVIHFVGQKVVFERVFLYAM